MAASNEFVGMFQSAIAEASGSTPAAAEAPKEEQQQQQPTETAPAPVQQSTQKAEAPKEETQAPVEDRFIEVKDDEGRARKVKVDTSKSLEDYAKKVYDYEKGMRKFQRERDELSKKADVDATQKWKEISATFKDKGVEGLIDLLGGKQGAYQEMVKSIEEKAIKRYGASEEEIRSLDREEQLARALEAQQRAEQKAESFITEAKEREFNANKAKVESRLESAFDKVKLSSEMLGDEARAASFNKIIWKETMDALEEYKESNSVNEWEISPATIQEIFAEKAELFRATIPALAAKQVEQKIAAKKDEATKHAQAHSTTVASSKRTLAEQAEDYIGKSGTTRGLFSSLFGN